MSKSAAQAAARRAKKQRQNSLIFLGASILIIGGIFIFSSYQAAQQTPAQAADTSTGATDAAAAEQAAYMAQLADDDPYRGPDNAPVVIVEFSDYLCPYCGKFHRETLPQILETYPAQVKFVHRDFLLMGEASLQALMGAGCALEQDKYWEMNDLLFSVYAEIDIDAIDHSKPPDEKELKLFQNKFSRDVILGYAAAIGLDMEAFTTCLDEEQTGPEVLADYRAAQELGIWSIPVYFINGQPVVGFRSFEDFQPYIEQALAASGQ